MFGAPRASARIALIVALSFSVGCGANSLADRGDAYVEAVANAIGVAPPTIAPPKRSTALPRRRVRRLEPTDHRIGILDFLSIQGCELGVLAAVKTSAMGRQMPYSMRLTHELAVLEVSDACIAELDDEELQLELESIVASKRAERGVHVWNALWAGDEIEAYLTPTPRVALESSSGDGAMSALDRLRIGVEGMREREADGRAVEDALTRLMRARSLGRALRDLDVASARLDAASEMVSSVDSEACGPVQARLVDAFKSTYLQFVQQPLGFAHRRVADELPGLHALVLMSMDALDAAGRPTPAPMRVWFETVLDPDAPDAVWPTYQGALRRHVAAWAPVLSVCGELATSSAADSADREPR